MKRMNVQVAKAPLRKEPSFLSPSLKQLSYADGVQVLSEKDGWAEVRTLKEGLSGWVHISALTTKTVILKPGEQDVQKAVSTKEYALAGKGFNDSVEKEYRSKNPNLNFSWIDRMETFAVSREKMSDFLRKGDLKTAGGKV